MEKDCYLHDLSKAPSPGAEIKALAYFDSPGYASVPKQVPGALLVLQKLREDGLVD